MLVQTLADVIRDELKRRLRRGRTVGPRAYLVIEGALHELDVPPFGTPGDKQLFFEFLASVGMMLKPTAIGFGGEAFNSDIPADQLRVMTTVISNNRLEETKVEAVRDKTLEHGFSSLNITAQDKQSAYFLTLPFTRIDGGIQFGEETRRFLPQASLDPEMGVRFYRPKKEGPARTADPC